MDFTKIADWLKLSSEQLLGLLAVSTLMLSVLIWAPDGLLENLGLRHFREEYRMWLRLALASSTT